MEPAAWHRVRLVGRLNYERAYVLFGQRFVAAGSPSDMAMYSAHSVGGLLELYFTPSAKDHARALLRILSAEPCAGPPAEATLEIGDNTVLERLHKAPVINGELGPSARWV